jgi:DUF1680 family protein
MCTRRRFVSSTALGSLCFAVKPLLPAEVLASATRSDDPSTELIGERVAASTASLYRAYRSHSSKIADVVTWIQIDLGISHAVDAIRLYPFSKPAYPPGDGFPVRFFVECSDDSTFERKRLLVDRSGKDFPDPGDRVVELRTKGAKGRYLRLTVTRMRPEKLFPVLAHAPEAVREAFTELIDSVHTLVLSKIEVMAGGVDIALGCPVSVDSPLGNPADAQQLTRPARPQGEGIITDNPRNVTSAKAWKPVALRVQPPRTSVRVQSGLFLTAIERNIDYLLGSFTLDDLLLPFRQRAGKPTPVMTRTPGYFWESDLAGSNAGRFLMGAGNTLRSLEHTELRNRMNAVVEGIDECRQANGYIMAYPENTFFYSERGAYTRAWVTHGLLEAGHAGNTRAFKLLRGYYDWYNSRPFLRQALRGCNQGGQGMVANTRVYFSPVGKPADIQVVQRYFQENYWRDDLASRRPEAIWQYPYDRPHAYLLTNLEAYLDLYRATGDRRYLSAVMGGWELYRENWQHIGGSISIIEGEDYPPKSNSLYKKLGETCGSAFWILLNQRLHLLEPEEEKFVAEIEKSIYNVLLANQSGANGIRYHTMLIGQKAPPTRENTCCEGQGARLLASLPEFIYSVADDGVFVNLYERSQIEWRHSGQTLRIEMDTNFPRNPAVRLKVHSSSSMHAKIRVRTPSWASGDMPIMINGERAATGIPGRYVTLERTWSSDDSISFVLPIAFKLTRYTGVDQTHGRERFALEYGPILMAAIGPETELAVLNADDPHELIDRLQQKPDQALHFVAPLMETEWVPYFEVEAQTFSCVPIIDARPL